MSAARIYPDRVERALAASRAQREAERQRAIQSATRCAWCGQPILNGAPCCDAAPWSNQ